MVAKYTTRHSRAGDSGFTIWMTSNESTLLSLMKVNKQANLYDQGKGNNGQIIQPDFLNNKQEINLPSFVVNTKA